MVRVRSKKKSFAAEISEPEVVGAGMLILDAQEE
jgi:hypothetical protein